MTRRRREAVRNAVTRLIAKHNIVTAPVDVHHIAHAEGIHVSYQSLEQDLDGFLYRDPTRTMAVINQDKAQVRQRFTLAHEIGHFMLHSREYHVDGHSIMARDQNSSLGIRNEEVEANTFASELLMPEALVRRAVKEREALHYWLDTNDLAAMFEVSHQAMNIRLGALGLAQSVIPF